jgi:membrane-associated HD superfamily phosphohydrolase
MSKGIDVPFRLGDNYYNSKYNCFTKYFDFKSATQISKDNLKFLSQHQADNLQQFNNLNYHFQLIYSLSFAAALVFSILALLSLVFLICFGKLCYQCPFWFYGFFVILTWLACSCGLMTFLYQFYSNRQRVFDPSTRLPLDNELLRLNPQLANLQLFGISFWFAVAATGTSFIGSFVSCIVCCRLPPTRHEDKEYKIMQLPPYA